MTNALQTRDESALTGPGMFEQLRAAFQAGILPPHVKSVEQAVAIAGKGREMGFEPYQALEAIVPIQGRYTVGPEALLSLAYRRVPGFVCRVVDSTAEKCVVDLGRNGVVSFRSTYTMDDARKAGLADKDNWRKNPVAMLRWRAMGAGLKIVCPDLRCGVPTADEAEEMDARDRLASVAKAGSLDDALAAPAPAKAPPRVVEQAPVPEAAPPPEAPPAPAQAERAPTGTDSPDVWRRDVLANLAEFRKVAPPAEFEAVKTKAGIVGKTPAQLTAEDIDRINDALPAPFHVAF